MCEAVWRYVRCAAGKARQDLGRSETRDGGQRVVSGRTCDLRCKRCGEAVQSGVVTLRAEEQRDTWLVMVVVVLMMWLYLRSVSCRSHVDIGIQNAPGDCPLRQSENRVPQPLTAGSIGRDCRPETIEGRLPSRLGGS